MCPLWPLHIILMYLLVIVPLWLVCCEVLDKVVPWTVKYQPAELLGLEMTETAVVNFTTQLSQDDIDYGSVYFQSSSPHVVKLDQSVPILLKTQSLENGSWSSSLNITGNFLGYADVKMVMKKAGKEDNESNRLKVTVIRKKRIIDKAFVTSVIILMFIIFINFGCAIDWSLVKMFIHQPIGPTIGFISQFLFMPLISYGLGILLFKESVPLRLGLFFTGISPAGGASNIWTFSLGGNLNLSITMTTISTLAAFVMIPCWAFSLGKLIFQSGSMIVPYSQIARSAVGLTLSLAIGTFLQFCFPKVSRFMVKILKPFSVLLIIFIIIFATITNLYLFRLFTWQIAAAGLGLPLIGYISGAVLASVCKQPPADVLAIAIETGIQNTGIAIFMLQVCLHQPEADLTTVVPVAVSVMSPVPLLLFHSLQKCWGQDVPAKTDKVLTDTCQAQLTEES